MTYILGKINCCCCGEKDGVIYSVCDYVVYGDVVSRIFYHPACLEVVEWKPERFGHRMMDKANHITDLQEKNISKCNQNIVKEFKEKVETLHQNHFEKMMPKK